MALRGVGADRVARNHEIAASSLPLNVDAFVGLVLDGKWISHTPFIIIARFFKDTVVRIK